MMKITHGGIEIGITGWGEHSVRAAASMRRAALAFASGQGIC